MALCHQIPVIPYGGGTGSQGEATLLYGGIVMDLKKMNKIIKIDEEVLTVTLHPGINGQQLEYEVKKSRTRGKIFKGWPK